MVLVISSLPPEYAISPSLLSSVAWRLTSTGSITSSHCSIFQGRPMGDARRNGKMGSVMLKSCSYPIPATLLVISSPSLLALALS